MNFITLPSGSLLNPVYISHVNREKDGVGIIIYTVHDEVFPESMSIEDFQNLLRGPAVTPIVSPIVNLDKLREGEPCSFTYEGTVKHGIISGFAYSNGAPYIKMIHDGDYYTKFLNTGEVI
jgi:hypothetical protein